MDDTFAVALMIGLILAGIATFVSLQSRRSAEQFAADKISDRGLLQSVIKQATSQFPPAMSATVSSSFIAIRAKVSLK